MIVAVNEKAFVCNVDSNQVNVIDIETNTFSDVIPISLEPICIKKDNLNRLWVLSREDYQTGNSSKITLINPQTNSIIKSFALDNNGTSPISLRINNSTNQVYFINKHIYRINGIDNSEQEIIWNNTGENFYNLEIDPYNNDIYLSDAKDYNSLGDVIILDSDGNLKNKIDTCGLITKSILF